MQKNRKYLMHVLKSSFVIQSCILSKTINNYESCIVLSAKSKVKRRDFKACFSINQCVHSDCNFNVRSHCENSLEIANIQRMTRHFFDDGIYMWCKCRYYCNYNPHRSMFLESLIIPEMHNVY